MSGLGFLGQGCQGKRMSDKGMWDVRFKGCQVKGMVV